MLKRFVKFFVRLKLFFHWTKNTKFVQSLFDVKDFSLIVYDENERRILLPYDKNKFSITKDFHNNSVEFIFNRTEGNIFVLKTARVSIENKTIGYQNMQDVALLYHEVLGIRKYLITVEDFFIFLPNFKKEEKVNLLLNDINISDVEKFRSLYKHFI